MMRATLNIPDALVAEVQRLTGAKTKTEAIITSMTELIRQRRILNLVAMRGKVAINYDWEKEEERELAQQKEREALLDRDG
jgi:Arc/MetJ family transcription regulator